MKLTLMRDNSGTLTMRTLDITLQIEAMKHETKPSVFNVCFVAANIFHLFYIKKSLIAYFLHKGY